jgi:drug/metabolite transporter (DMT)-like permease
MLPIVALAISFFFERFAWNWLNTAGVALSVMGNVLMLRQAGGKAAAG